jgi:hypothetical protein
MAFLRATGKEGLANRLQITPLAIHPFVLNV